MTASILSLLLLPLAALRPFEQPATSAGDEFPTSFKVSIADGAPQTGATSPTPPPASKAALAASAAKPAAQVQWTCEAYPVGTVLSGTSTSTHISENTDGGSERLEFLVNAPGRCTEAALIGKAVFSSDETRIVQLAPGGFMRLRERTATADRAMTAVPLGDGSLGYTATLDGRPVAFDDAMTSWVSRLLPEVLREAGINVPERVARFRAQGGVPAVLEQIAKIHSSGSKTMHYQELIKHGPPLSEADAERIAQQVGRDLTSSGDLSMVLQMLPRSALQSPTTRGAIAGALSHITSSGDKATTLEILAPNADPEMLLLLAKAAEGLPSSGDKANFLIATASEYLTPKNDALREAFFKTASTLQSSGDMANVFMSAMPYGHADTQIALNIVDGSKALTSSGDAANVLISLVSQRLLQPQMTRGTLAAIERTLTMASSGDRANVLISIGDANLLTNTALREAYIKAAMALPSDGDRANALAAVAKR